MKFESILNFYFSIKLPKKTPSTPKGAHGVNGVSLPTRCCLSPHYFFPGRFTVAFNALPGFTVNKG